MLFRSGHLLGVTEKSKRQVVLVTKTLVAVGVLWAYSGNLQPNSLDIVVDIPNRAGLFCASRREVGRDRKSVVEGKSVDLGGRRIMMKKQEEGEG